jgi:pyruvate/2-oxoglutarate/acetoin dehydrogenase E1 component
VLIAHEACTAGGFGAEVAARIYERHFDQLTQPVRRLGAAEVRMPSAPELQKALLPSAQTITAAARQMMRSPARSSSQTAGTAQPVREVVATGD